MHGRIFRRKIFTTPEKFSQQKEISHSKTKILTAKNKFPRQKKFSKQKKTNHDDRKTLTSKREKYSRSKRKVSIAGKSQKQ